MKIHFSIIIVLAALIFSGCEKYDKYPGGQVSPLIAIYDIRNMYKGEPVTLTEANMFGADKISGIVVSDHSGGNLPEGMIFIQESRRLNQLRGIGIMLGNDAQNFKAGDSVTVDVTNGILARENGILQIKGLTAANVTKLSSGANISPLIVKSSDVLKNPGNYEGTFVFIAKAGFDASVPEGSTYAGDKIINDGFGNLTLHTGNNATWATKKVPFLANFSGLLIGTGDSTLQLSPRSADDITVLSATPQKVAAVIITGYLVDPSGSDANYEYIQLMATRDIDFSKTKFSVATTNNAGANTPTGNPVNGWATGGLRTYKIDIDSGKVKRGQYFYVGAYNNIWGSGSSSIDSVLWISQMYGTVGGDGFGTPTTNLLANSGNAAGIAVFDTTKVDSTTRPVDVIFFGGSGGAVFGEGPPAIGYRITNTDLYDLSNLATEEAQPFFNQGSNKTRFSFPATGNFSQLGGVYNATTARWTTARALTNVPLKKDSQRAEIEGGTRLE